MTIMKSLFTAFSPLIKCLIVLFYPSTLGLAIVNPVSQKGKQRLKFVQFTVTKGKARPVWLQW